MRIERGPFPKYFYSVHDIAYDSIFIGDAIRSYLPNRVNQLRHGSKLSIFWSTLTKDEELRFIETSTGSPRRGSVILAPQEFIHSK